ncbi:MAG: hypothetical protein VX313_04625 [Bacteroidota bacterium]|nr:hypothetical protein [Bacteroidota bacterium]
MVKLRDENSMEVFKEGCLFLELIIQNYDSCSMSFLSPNHFAIVKQKTDTVENILNLR